MSKVVGNFITKVTCCGKIIFMNELRLHY